VSRPLIALALATLIAAAAPATAQSFGRNKVRYDGSKFQILETPHFDIYYDPADHDAVVQAGRLAERWYYRLSRTLGHTFSRRQPIVLYGSHAQFTQTNVIDGFIGDGITGVTEHERGRVVLPFALGLGETEHVLGHELVHAFQRDILTANGRAMAVLPLWFVEGMAEYLSVGGIDPNTAMWMRDAIASHHLPRIDQLDDPRWFPYRYGQALWSYLAGRFGEAVIAKALTSKASGGAMGRLMAVTGLDIRTLSNGWHESIQGMATATGPERHADTAVVTGANGGRLNLGPSLSPDGRSVVFLSERDQYSIDVFLADVETGTIQRKLIQLAGDPHFDSLQFVESAGAWNASGTRFALAAVAGGEPVISILRMPSGTVEQELKIRGVDQIFDPSWSPNGRQIVFSALSGGWTDLFLVDVTSGAVHRLTHDAFGDIQPAWSPDGSRIAFATDRFSSSLEAMTFGDFALATLDPVSRTIEPLPGLPGGKNIDPQWSADGRQIYFVADGGHTSNVYQLTLDTGTIAKLTDETTGISGITALSPALSFAPNGHRLAFSVYRDRAYEIHAIDVAPPPLEASTIADPTLSTLSSALPEVDQPSATRPRRQDGAGSTATVATLVDGSTFRTRPYRSGLSLERTIEPYLTAGGGSSGSFVRGGIGLRFGDMLGDQQLQTAIQAGASKDDFSAQAAYVNMRRRWSWALVGGQVPWLLAGGDSEVSRSADNTLTRESNVFRQLHRQMSGLAIYPFSGARRLEVSSGIEWIGFDRHTTTTAYSPLTGSLIGTETTTTAAAPSANLVQTSAAFIHDTSVFGVTGPVLGRRFRLSAAPTFGSVSFTNVVADYRAYLMPARGVTLAIRTMHLGRYGGGVGDERLLPLAWTLRDLVRGYGDYGPSADRGSYISARQITVGNAELRAPLGMLTRGHAPQGTPIDTFAFVDAGSFTLPLTAADSSTTRALASFGGGIRLNVAGSVFQFGTARSLHGAASGWSFLFDVRPGF
jgi:Tol biopolymer transport system component